MTFGKTQPGQNPEHDQMNREKRELRRAQERAQNQHIDLKTRGRESKTSYGYDLFQNYGELATIGINNFLADRLADPYKAGPHFSIWEYLLHFAQAGPRPIAVIALTCIIDRISTIEEKKKLGKIIGRALQDELNGTVIHERKGTVLKELVRRKYGRDLVTPNVMAQLQVHPTKWLPEEQRELGCLVLDIIKNSTGLIQERISGKKILIEPTLEVVELIRSKPPRAMPIRRLPLLVPPEPWIDVVRDGRQLVGSRRPMDLSHITKESIKTQIEVVNILEKQEKVVDPWMIEIQREAWEANLPVFPVLRNELSIHAMAHAKGKARIEEILRQGEEIAGRVHYLDHDFCFRGRTYTSSRMAGHQGPDYAKAASNFYRKEPADDTAFEHMLKAAAGHYGLGKKSWEDRLTWGQCSLDLIQAVAQNPLDRIDLWKNCADPWQFVQMAKAIDDWLQGDKESGVPIRFDQTCSGVGIISMLTRDKELARLTNCTGKGLHDLYQVVADDLMSALQADLHSFDFRSARMAEIWLKHPIDRNLTKGPIVTTVYGRKYFGIVDYLVEKLMDLDPGAPLSEWDRAYTWPAQYLARKLMLLIGHRLKNCIALDTWLRGVSKSCLKKQKKLEFHSPMGWPMSMGNELDGKSNIRTEINGSKRWKTPEALAYPGELSARATSRGLTAHFVHMFDASFCHALVQTMDRKGCQVQTNHDCFATVPGSAGTLHQALGYELREHFKENWLVEIKEEIQANAKIRLKKPPCVYELNEGEIGQNPYCFS